jgi:hypothetical protein
MGADEVGGAPGGSSIERYVDPVNLELAGIGSTKDHDGPGWKRLARHRLGNDGLKLPA